MANEPTEGQSEETDPNSPKGMRAALESTAEENRALKEELTSMKTATAFEKAGVPETGPGKYFRQAYDGEMSAEAIRTQAMADEIISDVPPQPEPDPVEGQTPPSPEVSNWDSEVEQMGRDEDAATGAPAVPATLEEQLRSAKSPEEVEALAREHGILDEHP